MNKEMLALTDKQLASADYRNIITLDGVNITDSDPYLYLILNIPRRKAYAGLSYATGKTHCRAGKNHTEDFYSGSPTDDNAMREWIDTDPPEHMVKVIVQNFPLPKNYARWGHKRKKSWLDDNLGQGERELIAYIRDKWGDHNKGENGILTNVCGGGINGGDQFKAGEDHPQFGMTGADNHGSIPVIEVVSGKCYAGAREAQRETGIRNNSISHQARKNAKRIANGEMLTASNYPGSTKGASWMHLSTFQDAVAKGLPLNVIDYSKRDAETVRLRDSGMAWEQVGKQVGLSRLVAQVAYQRTKMENKPVKHLSKDERVRRDKKITRLKDSKGLSWQQIGDLVGLSVAGARTAYNRTKLQETT